VTLAEQLADPGHVSFPEVQRLLTLFAQGLAGRHLHLKLVEAGDSIVRSTNIHADGASIHLPMAIDDFADRRLNLGAYRIAVLHQLGYLIEGTVDLDLEEFLSAWRRPALLRRVFSSVEDLRIDTALRRRYPGALRDPCGPCPR